ncbi:MAG: 50S ribosomal protein L5 [Nanoarchaeota archaeon]|nr:50S ribosomal protein L5 [Nanoarchaeota archaeon]MEC8339914.1 50S ribosomal protein L5 [Nanoarchaeota archaeon]
MEGVNKMREVSLDKVTVNICVGNDKPGMIKAEKLIKLLTKKTPVKATAKRRLALWQIRPGLPIGYKVTLREQDAKDFLTWIFKSKGNTLKKSSLDNQGNFALGVAEYLDLSGMKYDADIGIMGFELMATFTRPGFRIKSRRLRKAKIPQRHKVTQEEVVEYVQNNFGVKVE